MRHESRDMSQEILNRVAELIAHVSQLTVPQLEAVYA